MTWRAWEYLQTQEESFLILESNMSLFLTKLPRIWADKVLLLASQRSFLSFKKRAEEWREIMTEIITSNNHTEEIMIEEIFQETDHRVISDDQIHSNQVIRIWQDFSLEILTTLLTTISLDSLLISKVSDP